MAKSNPLFVDSTKLQGDRIGTQVELHNVLLYDDEILTVTLTNHHGEVQRVAMRCGEDASYQARAWLYHQKPVTYQFTIEKDGRELYRSQTHSARAQYAIIENWHPDQNQGEVQLAKSTPRETTLKALLRELL